MLQLVQSRPLTPDDLADPYLLLLDLLAEPS